MKTVGEILKESRQKKGMSSKDIAFKTKINLKYIKALEENDFTRLPEAAFVKGFIRNYAGMVGLDPQQALAVFRRDYDQTIKGKVVPRELKPQPVAKHTLWNPKTTTIVAIFLVAIALATYFIFQYQVLTSAPLLEVIKPKEGEQVTSTVTVSGKTDIQATLTINNQQVTIIEDGSFSQSLVLPKGRRTITIQAKSRSGKVKTVQRNVNVQ